MADTSVRFPTQERTGRLDRMKEDSGGGQDSSVPSRSDSRQNTFITQEYLNNKFQTFMAKNRLEKLRERLNYFYGRNYPLNYQDKFNFEQRWQNSLNNADSVLEQFLDSESLWVQLMFLVIMLCNCFLIWSITVDRVFKQQSQSFLRNSTATVGLISRALSIISKVALERELKQQQFSFKELCGVVGYDLGCMVYFIILLTSLDISHPLFIPAEMLIVAYAYSSASSYYKFFRILEVFLQYENQFKILDLFLTLFTIAHFIAMILWMATWYDSVNNWTISANIQGRGYLVHYLYSFYFCSTSILTIGYGDLSPKNSVQIMAVLFMQFFGVVVFGYLVNQIGYTLSVLRETDEVLQKDLVLLNKLAKTYKLQKMLVNKTKNFLVTNQEPPSQTTVQDEKDFFGKLNQELRNRILAQKTSAVVKSAIFFLCRWSKQMQNNVASHLQKIILAPNQRLLQPVGRERLYIIERGKVEISIDAGKSKGEIMRKLRCIDMQDPKIQIKNNVYGYTMVISQRVNRLKATAAAFTSCYFIDKASFIKSLTNRGDKEYFEEIKANLDQQQVVEAVEAPLVLNIREHYHPCRTILLKKHTMALKAMGKARRRSQPRSRRKAKLCIQTSPGFYVTVYPDAHDATINKHELVEMTVSDPMSPISYESTLKASDNRDNREKAFKNGDFTFNSAELSWQRQLNSADNLLQEEDSKEEKDITEKRFRLIRKYLDRYFERYFEYINYFPTSNIERVLSRMQTQTIMEAKNSLGMARSVVFESKSKLVSMRKILDEKANSSSDS